MKGNNDDLNHDLTFYYKNNQLCVPQYKVNVQITWDILLGFGLKTKLQTPAGADSNFYLLKNASEIRIIKIQPIFLRRQLL